MWSMLAALVWLSAADLRPQSAAEPGHVVETLYTAAKEAQASGDMKTAILKYEQILKIAPRLGPAYNNLGMLYLQERDLTKAAATLEQGLKVNPRMTSTTALLGLVYFQMSDFARARPQLEKAVKSNPADQNSHMLLAKDLMNLHKEEAAAAELHEVLAHDARNQEAWYLLGKADLAMSVSAMQKADALDPDSVLAHEIAGEVMHSMKNEDGALVEFQKAVQMAPTQPGTHQHLADALWEIGKWDSAREEYLAELENDSGNCAARWKAAHSLLEESGSSPQVATELEAALQQCPGLTGARLDLARVMVANGQTAKALPDLLEVEKVQADDPSVHFLLAKIYQAQGRKPDAEKEMQTYSKLQEASREAVANRAAEIESIRSKTN